MQASRASWEALRVGRAVARPYNRAAAGRAVVDTVAGVGEDSSHRVGAAGQGDSRLRRTAEVARVGCKLADRPAYSRFAEPALVAVVARIDTDWMGRIEVDIEVAHKWAAVAHRDVAVASRGIGRVIQAPQRQSQA